MRKSILATAIVLLMGQVFVLAPAGAQDALVEFSMGFAIDDDFNTDDGGWTASPVPPRPVRLDPIGSWEWGEPTSGPGFAASGSNVWATNLSGDYGARECAAILSPPITIPADAAANVSLQHWLFSERSTATFGLQDGGRLFVTPDGGDTLFELPPDQGYNAAFSTDARRCHDDLASGALGLGGPVGTTPPPAEYNTLSGDLSTFAGQTIQVAISFASTCCTHRPGWYIDDFAVTIDGVTTVEDFESSDGGFTLVSTRKHPGPAQGWSHGVATAGDPNNGTPQWATNLDGDYGHDECATLDSPTFRLGEEAAGPVNDLLGTAGEAPLTKATLRWSNWFRSNSIYAVGLVLIGTADGYEVLTPDQGYPGTIASSNAEAQAGLLACLGVDESQRAFSGLHQGLTADAVDLTADVTPWVGQEVNLRFIFASVWTPLNPTTQLGWYVDDVSVELVAEVYGPDTSPIDGLLPGDRTMPPGWSSGGTNVSWNYGVATSGPEGETVLGTNLDGDHNASECSYVTSPPVPGAALSADPTVSFEHWYQIASLTTSTAWSGGVVLVSTDLGETWEYLDLPEYTKPASFAPLQGCLTSHGLAATSRVFSGNKPTFDRVEVDLSNYVGSDVVQVRFLFGSYTSLTEEGWHLRSAELAGVPLI